MEIANIICTVAVYLLYMLEIIEAQKPCKVPNGDAGTCINIAKCQPLLDLFKKKHQTPHEHMYVQQAYCGGRVPGKHKVCCPSQSTWSTFVSNPVVFPRAPAVIPTLMPITNSPVFTNPGAQPPIAPAVLTIPSDVLGTRILPGEEDFNNFPEEEKELKKICGIDTSSSNKIIGGKPAAIDQYPWLALLEYSGSNLACGGSLISHKFVLTAAHCLNGLYGEPLKVRLAEYNTTSFPTDAVEQDGGGMDYITVEIIEVKAIHMHPNYSRSLKIHDIGLIEMMTRVNIKGDFIKVICLPDRNFISEFKPSVTNFTIAGWGGTNNVTESEIKLHVSVPYVPWDRCEKVQGPDVMVTQICAGGIQGEDSCSGDSGGPLMYESNANDRYYVVGIISYGSRYCGTEGSPATHTNVYEYIPWIKDILSGKIRN